MEPIGWVVLYKIACLATAGGSIFLGFKLFELGVTGKAGDIGGSGNGYKFKLVNAAPGTMFALVGASIAWATIAQGLENKELWPTDNETQHEQPPLSDTPIFKD